MMKIINFISILILKLIFSKKLYYITTQPTTPNMAVAVARYQDHLVLLRGAMSNLMEEEVTQLIAYDDELARCRTRYAWYLRSCPELAPQYALDTAAHLRGYRQRARQLKATYEELQLMAHSLCIRLAALGAPDAEFEAIQAELDQLQAQIDAEQ